MMLINDKSNSSVFFTNKRVKIKNKDNYNV